MSTTSRLHIRMLNVYGRRDDQCCGHCIHIKAHRVTRTHYKCELAGFSRGPATDWRLKWPACGKFEAMA